MLSWCWFIAVLVMGAVFERDGYVVEVGCILNDDKTMGDDNKET